MPSFKTINFSKKNNEVELKPNLNLLAVRRKRAEVHQATYKHQVTKYYNKRIKRMSFLLGDLVLRKVTLSTKTLNTMKLDPTWEDSYKIFKVFSTNNSCGHYVMDVS